jgi:pilus assembly protein CpaB
MRSRAVLMLGLAVVLAVGAVFLAQNWLKGQSKQSPGAKVSATRVVVARNALNFGAIIREENLRYLNWPSKSIPDGAFASIKDIIGDGKRRVALRRIEINEPVLKSKISGFGGRASLSAVISENMRAATIRVNDVRGVAGFVLPGDRVDVMITRDPITGKRIASKNLMTDVLLQNVKVLAIDQNSNETKDKPSVAKAVTLEVTTLQAQKLVLAQLVGTLSLALRNVNNVSAAVFKTVKIHDLRVGEVNGESTIAPKKTGQHADQ